MDKKNLIIDSRPYGFFSIFLHTIDNLKWAEDNGYEPHVRWGPGRVDVNHGRPGATEASKRGHPSFVGNDPNFFNNKHIGEVKKSLYFSPDGYNGSSNVWEYYFEPVGEESSDYKISDIFQVGFHDLKIDSLNEKFLIYNLHSYTPLTTWLYFKTDSEAESLAPSKESHFFRHRKMCTNILKNMLRLKKK